MFLVIFRDCFVSMCEAREGFPSPVWTVFPAFPFDEISQVSAIEFRIHNLVDFVFFVFVDNFRNRTSDFLLSG
jgi:hypothetical protein